MSDEMELKDEESYYLKSFMRSLKKRLAHRREWAKQEQTSGYRLFDRENNIPVTIDFFNDKYAVVVAYLEKDQEWIAQPYLEVVQKALGIASTRLFYKERIKGSRHGYEKNINIPSKIIEMSENGLYYKLNLSDYLDIGIFMDHRNLRRELREHAYGIRVLNLFCYTASFGVSMASGGASEVVNIDLSSRYLEIAKENFKRNGLLGESFRFIKADIMAWLRDPPQEYFNYFDVIVCDPPAFSNSRSMSDTLNIQRDYIWLIEQSAKLLKKKSGVLYFSSPLQTIQFNSRKFSYLRTKEITDFTVPYDFRKNLPHRAWQVIWSNKPPFESGGRKEWDYNSSSANTVKKYQDRGRSSNFQRRG